MDLIKQINIESKKLNSDEPMTAIEIGKLWTTYIGNSMSNHILRYFRRHVEDVDIKILLENGLRLSDYFLKKIEEFFKRENIPIPVGFTEEDVNVEAPRLFEDQFYVFYLKYAAKAGLSIYAVAIPLVMREDIRNFFHECNGYTTTFLEQLNKVLIAKGFLIKPPSIPIPKEVDFVEKQTFLTGFFGETRPLHAMEITHLFDNIENNITSKALLIAFSQVAQREEVRDFMIRGKNITDKQVESFRNKLELENLPSPTILDHLVTPSTISPFSDRIMLFHKVDMFNIKIRSFGNSLAVNGRSDIGAMYMKCISDVSFYVEDGANLLIKNGWMEEPPKAVDRDNLKKS